MSAVLNKEVDLILIPKNQAHFTSFVLDTAVMIDVAAAINIDARCPVAVRIWHSDTGQYGEFELIQFLNATGGLEFGIPRWAWKRFVQVELVKPAGVDAVMQITWTSHVRKDDLNYGWHHV